MTADAAEVGFTVPVAFTRSAHSKAVVDALGRMRYAEDVTEGMPLAGVIDLIHFHVLPAPPADRLTVSFDIAREKVTFEIVCGPGGDEGTCATVMPAGGIPAAGTGRCDRCRRSRGVPRLRLRGTCGR